MFKVIDVAKINISPQTCKNLRGKVTEIMHMYKLGRIF